MKGCQTRGLELRDQLDQDLLAHAARGSAAGTVWCLLFGALLLRRVRAEVLFRERRTKWVKELVLSGGN